MNLVKNCSEEHRDEHDCELKRTERRKKWQDQLFMVNMSYGEVKERKTVKKSYLMMKK